MKTTKSLKVHRAILLCLLCLFSWLPAAAETIEIQADSGTRYSTSQATLKLVEGTLSFRCHERVIVNCLGQSIVCEEGRYELSAQSFKGQLKVVSGKAHLEIDPSTSPSFETGQVFSWEALGQQESLLLQSLGMCE